MLFRQRATQREHFDDPSRTREEMRHGYAQLARVNTLFRLADPYTRLLSRWLGERDCRQLSILDLGAGDCSLGAEMERWASRRGWAWRVTNLDLNPVPLQWQVARRNVVGSVTALPFAERSFDVVIASQMTHHLDAESDVERHFREAWRVTRLGVFITDMQRNAFLFAAVWLISWVVGLTPAMRADGLLSVRRAWRPAEWRALAARAGLRNAKVSDYFGARVILAARKDACASNLAASGTSEACRAMEKFCSAPTGK